MFTKETILTPNAPQPIGPYSQAIRVQNMQTTVFISGQVPINPATGKLVEGTIEQQTQQVMDNLLAILKEANMDFSHVLKTTIFLTDMGDFGAMNQIYASALKGSFPARETVAVKALPAGAQVEISAIAAK